MSIQIVRLGDPRDPEEGVRLGTVRRPPRGVRKEDYARLNYFDLWLPDLAPSAELVSLALSEPFTAEKWTRFVQRYRREMKEPGADRLIKLLALLSHQTSFSVGCYCEDEERCHRSVLRELLLEQGAKVD
jgi:uncharacterized protein YeaO (DUF488 family)